MLAGVSCVFESNTAGLIHCHGPQWRLPVQALTGGYPPLPSTHLSLQYSVLHSHWSRNVEARLSLVESFMMLLCQLSYAIKNQRGASKQRP